MEKREGHLLWAIIWLLASVLLIGQFFFLNILGGYAFIFPVPLYLSFKEFYYYIKNK